MSCRMSLVKIVSVGLLMSASTVLAQQSVSLGEIERAANLSGDKSMALLELVFGPVVRNPLAGIGAGGGMVAHMFMVLVSCMLAVGVVWALYHFVAAMIATAQSGEFLGERKSSPWFVVRMGAGFTALVPIFGGYCGAQILMLWGTLMGIGIANLTLDAAITVLKSGGSMVAMPVSPQATTLAKSLFEANLCAEAANAALANMPSESGVSVDAAERFSAVTERNKIILINHRGLSCGGATLNMAESQLALIEHNIAAHALDTQLFSAHQNALAMMQSALAAQARQYVLAISRQLAPPDALSIVQQAAYQYEAIIQQALQSASSTLKGLANLIESNLKRDGWIMMGTWYQTFAQANVQASNMANATAAVIPGTDIDHLPYPQLYRKVLAVYSQQYQQAASTSTAQGLAHQLSAGTSDPKHALSKIFPGQKIVKWAIDLNQDQGPAGLTNPLIGMKNLGDAILDAGWTALASYVGWKAIEGASESNLGKVAGIAGDIATGGVLGAAKGAAKGVLDALGPFVVMMIIVLFFFGAMLSIYLPMLPFIIWFGGVASWFAVVGEAMIASPLWAMTHLDGEGEGIGQRSTHGYIFLLNVMFRPVFMMIGFALAGAAVVVLGTLLNTMFGVAMQNAQYDSTTGLVSIIGFIVLYVGMCQMLCNTCFGLINVVPDQVFAWIGGQMANRVGADMDDKTKAHYGQGVSQGSSSARGLASSLGRDGSGSTDGTSSVPSTIGKKSVS